MMSVTSMPRRRATLQSLVRRWRRIAWPDRALLGEAMIAIVLSSVAISILPFRALGRLASVQRREAILQPEIRRALCRRVAWAVRANARRVPWRAACFQQGLAAQLMLRRRGIPTVMCYGVAPDKDSGLAAHVWVRDGEIDVIGGEAAARFAVLAAFPAQPAGACPPTTGRSPGLTAGGGRTQAHRHPG